MTERKTKNILVLKFYGELDALVAPKVKEILAKHVENGNCRLVINFQEVSHINSLTMGILRGKLREAREMNGDIKLVGLSEHVKNIFEMVGLDELFEMYEDENKAIVSF